MNIFGKGLARSIVKSSTSHDLLDKIGETALDIALDEGVIRDIPIIGTAISLFKAGDKVKAYLFTKKILSFLEEIEKIPSQQREKFFEKNISSEKEQDKLTDTLLLYIESANNFIVCKLLGRCLKLYINGTISKYYYDMCCLSTIRMTDYLLRQVHGYYISENSGGLEFHAMNELASLGIIDLKTTMMQFEISDGPMKGNKTWVEMPFKNKFGKIYYDNIVKLEFREELNI